MNVVSRPKTLQPGYRQFAQVWGSCVTKPYTTSAGAPASRLVASVVSLLLELACLPPLTPTPAKFIVVARRRFRPNSGGGRYAPMNLPNSLTLLRIFFVPLLIVVLLTRSPNVELWGFHMRFEFWGVLILLVAAATDWADGFFARRRLQVTTLGILLDPIADKLLISAAFISLVDMHLVQAWMVVIIVGREFTVLGLRNIASAEGFTIAASALGKTKMVLQVCAVAVLIAGASRPYLQPIAQILLWLVVASALISAAQYFYRFWSQLDDRIKQRRKLRMMEARAKSEDVVPS
jgi:CDP-diacylglycerol---glycerol-3-phosphate 3-phosphatidyltransferase